MLPADTTVGAVHLAVSDLDRSLAYYEHALGLQTLDRDDGHATVGVPERPLLRLAEVPGAPPADGYTGLFHFALLVPERGDLARWLAHAAREKIPLTGASDHFVSEAIYLRDPDHHGIEVYWDRPREVWEGQVERMGTWPLDVDGLLGTIDNALDSRFDALAPGTRMGHVHLRVAEIDATVGFYRDVLGFDLVAQLGPQAAFLSAGGYHHHVGANVWESRGAPPAPEGSARLRFAEIVLGEESARADLLGRVEAAGLPTETAGPAEVPVVVDPSGNRLLLTLAGA